MAARSLVALAVALLLSSSLGQWYGDEGDSPYGNPYYGNPMMGGNPYGGMFGGGMYSNPMMSNPYMMRPAPAVAVTPAQVYRPAAEEVLAFEASPYTTEIAFDRARTQEEHNTNTYRGGDETPESVEPLIVRRGQPFMVRLILRDSEGTEVHNESLFRGFRLIATSTFSGNRLKDNPFVDVPLNATLDASVPFCRAESPNEFTIWLPNDAHVGHFVVAAVLDVDALVEVPTVMKLIVLFNPWQQADQTYIEGEEERDEYVMNEDGMAWGGTEAWRTPMPWSHEQFSKPVYETALRYLDYVRSFDDRKDAVEVARLLSALLNANDENGLVVGKWEPPYWGGRSPESWGASRPIFSYYRMTNSPVRYGQCWVFAGVLCTAGRALGIPSRLITNYNSAHEEGRHGVYKNEVDVLFLPNGLPLQAGPSKVWNFHQWVEYHLRREPNSMDGWQVVDATPQELSPPSGVYQVGPASVTSIRDRSKTDFDTDFVISEINSIVNNYFPYAYGGPPHPTRPGFYLMSRIANSTGRLLLTKAVGSFQPVDITRTYKIIDRPNEEGMQAVEYVPEKAFKANVSRPLFAQVGEDCNLTVTIDCDSCDKAPRQYDMTIVIVLETLGALERSLGPRRLIRNETITIEQATRRTVTTWKVSEREYSATLHTLNAIGYSIGIVERSPAPESSAPHVFSESNRVPLWVPPPQVSTRELHPRSFELVVRYQNPLSTRRLNNVKLQVSGSIVEPINLIQNPMEPKETRGLRVLVKVRPGRDLHKAGLVTARVLSDELVSSEALLLVSQEGAEEKRKRK